MDENDLLLSGIYLVMSYFFFGKIRNFGGILGADFVSNPSAMASNGVDASDPKKDLSFLPILLDLVQRYVHSRWNMNGFLSLHVPFDHTQLLKQNLLLDPSSRVHKCFVTKHRTR